MEKNKRLKKEDFFEQIYRQQFQKLCRYANTMLCNEHLAEEAVQDAFLEFYRQLDKLWTCDAPERWLQQTVKNKTRHILRTQAQDIRRLVSLDSEEAPTIAAPDELDKIETCVSEDLKRVKENILNSITKEEFLLLKRVAFQKLTHKQLAEELGISLDACHKRIQRIRAKLKNKFNQ